MATEQRRPIILRGPLYVEAAAGEPITCARLFGDDRPLVVDVGAARARLFLNIAGDLPDVGFLGIELRRKRVESALARLEKHGLHNCRMAAGNAVEVIAERLQEASVAAFTVLYPDPWPKKRHAKRRIYRSRETAWLFASRLRPGGLLLFKSDVASYFDETRATFEKTPGLVPTDRAVFSVAGGPPVDLDRPQETYYERKWLDEGRSLFRACFRRTDEALGEPPASLEEHIRTGGSMRRCRREVPTAPPRGS